MNPSHHVWGCEGKYNNIILNDHLPLKEIKKRKEELLFYIYPHIYHVLSFS